MLTKQEREIATCLVLDLIERGIPDNFEDPMGVERWAMDNNVYESGYWVSCGMTKVCIGHSYLKNWVIKFGFNAKNCKKNIDYMAREYEIYREAEHQNMTEFFPQTFLLGRFDGRDYYIQELAECDENTIYSECYNQICSFYEEEDNECNPDWIWNEVDGLNDNERVNLLFHSSKLIEFLSEHEINDLHEGNFGLINGNFVIIDFSGY